MPGAVANKQACGRNTRQSAIMRPHAGVGGGAVAGGGEIDPVFCCPGGADRFEDFEDVGGQFARGAVRPVLLDGGGHVEQADDAVVRHLAPVAQCAVGGVERVGGDVEFCPVGAFFGDFGGAAEEVGVRHEEGAVDAVEFEGQALVFPDVPRGGQHDGGAGGEGEDGGGGGFHLDLEGFAGAGLAGDGAGGVADAGGGGDAGHGAEELDEVGDVVGPEVEDGSAAFDEEEVGVGVPVFHAVGEDGGGAGDDGADAAVVDGAAAGLVGGAHEGVGRAADPHAGFGGEGEQVAGFGEGGAEGFFGVDMFAGGDDGAVDRGVGEGDGEVDDDGDVGVGQEGFDRRGGGDAVFRGFGGGGDGIEDEVDVAEVAQGVELDGNDVGRGVGHGGVGSLGIRNGVRWRHRTARRGGDRGRGGRGR